MSSRLSWATDWGSVSTEPKKARREEGSKERNIEAGGVNSEASLGSKARPCLKSTSKYFIPKLSSDNKTLVQRDLVLCTLSSGAESERSKVSGAVSHGCLDLPSKSDLG